MRISEYYLAAARIISMNKGSLCPVIYPSNNRSWAWMIWMGFLGELGVEPPHYTSQRLRIERALDTEA